MARSDLLKRLFRSYRGRNDAAFLEAAREIVAEERKKHHEVLADELLRILDNGAVPSPNGAKHFDPIPKDADRGAPLIEVSEPDRYLQDVILTDFQSRVLEKTLVEFRQWEVLEANALRPANKLLFCGPPGCGKSATAAALSAELGVPLITVRFDAVVSSLLGETAANLRKVFDYAARGTWVLLFDEFDAIGRSRDDPTEHGELKRVVNTFLQMLDRFGGRSLVVAATNYERSLDAALWRRFDEVIRFEKPDRCGVERLLERKLAPLRPPPTVVPEAATRLEGSSFADVERVCVDILKRAAISGRRSLCKDDLEDALRWQEEREQALLKSRTPPAARADET
jgi:SpoVK/Ycf46/Vps4 family AAA+-type ATPase